MYEGVWVNGEFQGDKKTKNAITQEQFKEMSKNMDFL